MGLESPKFGILKFQTNNWLTRRILHGFFGDGLYLHQVHSLDLEYQVTKAFEVPIGIIRDWLFFPKCHETFLGKSEAISRSTTPKSGCFTKVWATAWAKRLKRTGHGEVLRGWGEKGPFPNKETVMVMSWSNDALIPRFRHFYKPWLVGPCRPPVERCEIFGI